MSKFKLTAVLVASVVFNVTFAATGPKVSVLGDSISSYSGMVPSGNGTYYPKEDVTSPSQMWWSIVIDRLQGSLEVNESWSGGSITYANPHGERFVAANLITRVPNLGAPDVIFVFGGANDDWYTMPGSATSVNNPNGSRTKYGLGDYTFTEGVWSVDPTATSGLYYIRPALACLCRQLRRHYPDARIYFIVDEVGAIDDSVEQRYEDGTLTPATAESIKAVCAYYGIPTIQLPHFDKVTRHPTAGGMETIANAVLGALETGDPFPVATPEPATGVAPETYADEFLSCTGAVTRIDFENEVVYSFAGSYGGISVIPAADLQITQMLLVGGGGAGGWTIGGGGGGGQVAVYGFENEVRVLPRGSTVKMRVGLGGGSAAIDRESADSNNQGYWLHGTGGGATSIRLGGTDYVALGGGGGGAFSVDAKIANGGAGASGGGAARQGAGGAGLFGGAGGASTGSTGSNYGAGGGGGASGAAGGTGTGTQSGAGGGGVSCEITGTPVVYGAGGGGGGGNDVTSGAAGGMTAGAGADKNTDKPGGDALAGSGSGGGGGCYSANFTPKVGYRGGNGGSGVVILRIARSIGLSYPVLSDPAVTLTGATSARMSVRLVTPGYGAESAEVFAVLSKVGQSDASVTNQLVASDGTVYAASVSGLADFTRYEVYFFATNGLDHGIGRTLAAVEFQTQYDLAKFSRSTVLRVSGYAGSGALGNFPVLVRVSPKAIFDFDYSQCAAGGADLRFTSNGEPIPHEIDTWNTAGESLVWVRVPRLEDDARFEMHWGADPARLIAVDPTAVWSAYAAVWHFNDLTDATGHGLNLTATGVTGTDGRLGSGYLFDETKYAALRCASPFGCLNKASDLSVSLWMETRREEFGVNDNGARLVTVKSAKEDNGFDFFFSCSRKTDPTFGYTFTARGSGGDLKVEQFYSLDANTFDGWKHLECVFNGKNGALALNGSARTTATISPVLATDADLTIGNLGTAGVTETTGFNGVLDEVRLYNGAMSDNWRKAEYDSVANVKFLTEVPDAAMLTEALRKGFVYSVVITVPKQSDSADLVDFPVPVRISKAALPGFLYSQCAAGGSDIRFIAADGTILPHEIDCWQPGGESLAWVRVDLPAGQATAFTMLWRYAGKDRVPAWSPEQVWRAYAGVWHMNGDGVDSTGNGYTLTAKNVGTESSVFGPAAAFVRADGSVLSTSASIFDSVSDANKLTVSGWFMRTIRDSARLLSTKSAATDDGFDFFYASDNWTDIWLRGANNALTVKKNGYTFSANTVNHLAIAMNGTTGEIYIDGVREASGKIGTPIQTTAPLMIGGWTALNVSLEGTVDEVRAYNGVASAERIRVEAASAAPDFVTFGKRKRRAGLVVFLQ